MKSQEETERELWRQTRDKYPDYAFWLKKHIFKELLQLYRSIKSVDVYDPEEPQIQQIIREAESKNQDDIEMQIAEMEERLLQYYYDHGIRMDYLGDMYGYDDADDIDEIIDSVDSTVKKKETKYKGPGFAVEFMSKDDPFYNRGYVIGITNASHFPKNTPEKTSSSGKKKRTK